MPEPSFVDELTPDSMHSVGVPLSQLLEGCVYYPASGMDGTPIRAYGRRSQSFVYCDWSASVYDFCEALNAPAGRGSIAGYDVVSTRKLTGMELVGNHAEPDAPGGIDWDCLDYRGNPLEQHRELLNNHPVAVWFLLERAEGRSEAYGPAKLSLLCIHQEASRIYRLLFNHRGCRPHIVCWIQPGRNPPTSYARFPQNLREAMAGNSLGWPPYMAIQHPYVPEQDRHGQWPPHDHAVPDLLGDWINDVTRPPVETVDKDGEQTILQVSLFKVAHHG